MRKHAILGMFLIFFMRTILHECYRAFIFSLFTVFFTIIGIMSASYVLAASPNGGIFGTVLNTILASGDWQNPGDGTVKNAEKLAGQSPNAFAKFLPGQTCPANQCISSIRADGTIVCK